MPRFRPLAAVLACAVPVVVACSASTKDTGTVSASASSTTSATASATSATATATVACGDQVPPPPQHETFASEPPMTIDTAANYTMTLHTSCGAISIELYASKAPHTVNALAFLAAHKFFDGTFCHRLVISSGLTVLQCGDPTGTGSGGPGFTIPEENLTGATYPRGTLAMAKTSAPHSTSSQFFLVDQNSQLPPQYTVAGKITAGLDVLDKIIAVGEDDANGPGDGAPKLKVYLDSVTVSKS